MGKKQVEQEHVGIVIEVTDAQAKRLGELAEEYASAGARVYIELVPYEDGKLNMVAIWPLSDVFSKDILENGDVR